MINGVPYINSSVQTNHRLSSIPSPLKHSIQPLQFRINSPQVNRPSILLQGNSMHMIGVSNRSPINYYPTIPSATQEIPNSQMSFMPKPTSYSYQLNSSFSKNQQRIQAQMPNIQRSQFESRQKSPQQLVSKAQFDRCVMQCQNWSTKYNELYLKYLNAVGNHQQRQQQTREYAKQNRQKQPYYRYQNESRPKAQIFYHDNRNPVTYSFELQFNALKKENSKLRQELRQNQNIRQKYYTLRQNMHAIISKCKQQTMKACLYEIDKFKLNQVMNEEDD